MSTLEIAREAVLKEFPEYKDIKNPIVTRKIRKLLKIFVAGMKYGRATNNGASNIWHSVNETPENYRTIIYENYDSSIQVKYLFDNASYMMAKATMKRWAYLDTVLPKDS